MYNEAHELARAIKQSQEFSEYKKWHLLVMQDPKKRDMVEDYQKKVMALQVALMEGKEPDEQKMNELRSLEGILTANSVVKSYLEAQMRFSTVFSDVQKILSDAIDIPVEENVAITEDEKEAVEPPAEDKAE